MPIPPVHAGRFLYHFTHIDNLTTLLKTGFLAKNHPNHPADGCRSIAEESIQDRRMEMAVPCPPGGVVHDYVPLYFGSVSPMLLAVINKKNVDQMDILYFEFPISLLEVEDVIFTDASANTLIPPSFFSDASYLASLNWSEIDSRKWKSDSDDLKHQRMAEALVHMELPLMAAARVVVWNDHVAERVRNIVQNVGVAFPPIESASFERPHWFTNFMEGGKRSLVTGPRMIAETYKRACQAIKEMEQTPNRPFTSLASFLNALRLDFGCIPQTAELVGLRSANGLHRKTVDVHTCDVVTGLKGLPEFKELEDKEKQTVEIAAYLHDIGKGPKSRWAASGGLQKVDPDHAVRAVPMVVDIFSEHLGNVSSEEMCIILKLVCYHDLVGEVLGKGRDEQQIRDVANNKRELDMLFMLGKADATALSDTLWDLNAAADLYGRCLQLVTQTEAGAAG